MCVSIKFGINIRTANPTRQTRADYLVFLKKVKKKNIFLTINIPFKQIAIRAI